MYLSDERYFMGKKIHVISFSVPYPADYGAVIDVYYKLKALQQAGLNIILHCFENGRLPAPELDALCEKVYYYPTKNGMFSQLSCLPNVVSVRNHPDLLKNLLDEIAPVLFEGIQSCYLFDHPLLSAYQKIVRVHHIEHLYFANMAGSEKSAGKKYYYRLEAYRLKQFEKKLKSASQLIGLSSTDTEYFKASYGNALYVPAFHPHAKVISKPGKGDYILFHGNLSLTENLDVVKYLLRKIFSEITVPFVIAGKNPPAWLVSKAKVIPHVSVIGNPTKGEMTNLIREAQICLVPGFHTTGLKLKLLASLFCGRHCLTNSTMLYGSGLSKLCHIADTPEEMINLIGRYMELGFTSGEIIKRRHELENLYSNEKNAKKILAVI
ncbi:hypothetical protein [Gaoshiqia sp. Z1-71]|uniref:hypothetical protein n=1 Tax=Gaoshiqia hydrogeniformans TaxID=3290090 RepID=UPI003BF9209B